MVPGPDDKPIPLISTVKHSRPSQLSVIDIDARDMRYQVFVDGVLQGLSTDFDLDKSIDCGQDVNVCIEKGFAMGTLNIPPGHHTIKVEWIGKGAKYYSGSISY